jgi:hypothetical protein
MKLYLMTDRSVILVDDLTPTVTVEPGIAGTLTIDDESFEIEAHGSPVPVSKNQSGTCHVWFKTKEGIQYRGDRTVLRDGVPHSVADYATGYVPLRLKLDDLERQNDRLTAEFHKLAAEIEPDSLGHINIGG